MLHGHLSKRIQFTSNLQYPHPDVAFHSAAHNGTTAHLLSEYTRWERDVISLTGSAESSLPDALHLGINKQVVRWWRSLHYKPTESLLGGRRRIHLHSHTPAPSSDSSVQIYC